MPPIMSPSEIATGSQYPPARERSRHRTLQTWYRYSQRDWAGLLPGVSEPPRLTPNMFRFVAEFWREAVMSSRPSISYEGGGRNNQVLKAMAPSLFAAADDVVYDMARYGMGVFFNKRPFAPEALDPRFWFPVRAPDDVFVGHLDIVAYPYSTDVKDMVDNRIRVEVIENPSGDTIVRRHMLDGLTIGNSVDEIEQTVRGAPAVVPVRFGDGFYGSSMFADIAEYVAELFRIESNVSGALEKHTNPHLAVPEGSLTTDEHGIVRIDREGMAIPVPEGGHTPEYIVWDPSFDAQESAIERAVDRILKFAHISPILVSTDASTNIPASGVALRRLAIPTVQRIRKIRGSLTEAMKATIVGNLALSASLGGEVFNLDPDRIVIIWSPELTSGVTDDAPELATLVGSNILPPSVATQIVTSVNREEAEEMVDSALEANERRPVQTGGDQ